MFFYRDIQKEYVSCHGELLDIPSPMVRSFCYMALFIQKTVNIPGIEGEITIEAILIKYERGKEQKVTVYYNCMPVKLANHGYPLFLVVARGSGKCP